MMRPENEAGCREMLADARKRDGMALGALADHLAERGDAELIWEMLRLALFGADPSLEELEKHHYWQEIVMMPGIGSESRRIIKAIMASHGLEFRHVPQMQGRD